MHIEYVVIVIALGVLISYVSNSVITALADTLLDLLIYLNYLYINQLNIFVPIDEIRATVM